VSPLKIQRSSEVEAGKLDFRSVWFENLPVGMVQSCMLYSLPKPSSTREKLLQTAFWEMYERGYSGTSLQTICSKLDLTKGAFFYHFTSKKELGVAVIKEIIRPLWTKVWFDPFKKDKDPIVALVCILEKHRDQISKYEIQYGCILQNLSQELSPIDKDFHKLLSALFDDWSSKIRVSLETGKKTGTVRKDLDSMQATLEIISHLYGALTLAKSFRLSEKSRLLLDCLIYKVEQLGGKSTKYRNIKMRTVPNEI